MNYTEGDGIEVYNRPAVVEKALPSQLIVRWQDNYTQGIVPRDHL